MTIEKRYENRYKLGDTPWEVGQPDFNLFETVTENKILNCKVLDVGCGTGDKFHMACPESVSGYWH
jgi:hypothetical protein